MMCFDLAVGCCLSPGPISTKDAAEFTLLPGDQERYGDKDGGIGSGDDTNQDDSGKLPDGGPTKNQNSDDDKNCTQ